MKEVKLTKAQEILFEVYDKGVQNQDCNLEEYVEKMKQALSIADVSVSVCACEMPAKVKGKNECWRCKKPFKEFLQTER